MPDIKFPSIPSPNANDVKSLAASIGAMKEILEILLGQRGDLKNKAITTSTLPAAVSAVPGLIPADGTNGTNGVNGIDGCDGDDGWTIPGARGPAGADGLRGVPGRDGEDADTVWLFPPGQPCPWVMTATGIYYTAGNVSVGAISGNAKVTITGNATYNEAFTTGTLFVADAANGSRGVDIGYDPTLEAGFIQAGKAGTAYEPLYLNPNNSPVGLGGSPTAPTMLVTGGKVGIGVTPSWLLHLKAGADQHLAVQSAGGVLEFFAINDAFTLYQPLIIDAAPLYLNAHSLGVINFYGPLTQVPAPSGMVTIDCAGAVAPAVAPGGSYTLKTSIGIVIVREGSLTGGGAVYFASPYGCTLMVADPSGVWVPSTTTPGANTLSVALSGGLIKIFSNRAANCIVQVMQLSMS